MISPIKWISGLFRIRYRHVEGEPSPINHPLSFPDKPRIPSDLNAEFNKKLHDKKEI